MPATFHPRPGGERNAREPALTATRTNPYLRRARRRRPALRRRLPAWFRRYRADLPWRRTRDPYAIWIAEVMLQQTRVGTVIPYYERFLARFPTVGVLARAGEDAVLKAWQGLGYYRRALNLRRAAQAVVRDHGGRLPDDPEALAALPGVGPYTCGAVRSIAFGHAVAAVDGNTLRVLARWLDVLEPIDDRAVRQGLWRAAEALVPARAPGDWNQALMELGRAVCRPRQPRCSVCPVRPCCGAARQGYQARLPLRRPRKPVPHIEVGAGIVWRRGRVLLCRRPADAMLGGLWEFPGGKRRKGESIQACIRRELREECDLAVTVGEHLVDVTHAYTHLRVTLRCYHCRAGPGRAKKLGCADARWVRPADIASFALPAADVRVLEALGLGAGAARRSARGRA